MRLFLFTAVVALQFNHPPSILKAPEVPTDRFVRDMRSKDIEDVLAMYTQYPLFIDPEGHSFNTPESLRKLYEQVFATYDSDIHLQRTGLRDAGRVYSDPDPASPPTNSQIETGTYTEDLRTRDTGTVMHVCGGYTFTWQYVNRSHWLISRMEWTSTSCPAPPVK